MSNDIQEKLNTFAIEIASIFKDDIPEITLSGSLSRNVADEYSDIELDFWCDEIPNDEHKTKILSKLPIENLKHKGSNKDGSQDSEFTYNGQLVEVMWQSYSGIENLVKEIFELKTTDYEAFLIMWTIKYQKNLQSTGRIDQIREKIINNYPKGLSKLLIEKTIKDELEIPMSRFADIQRNELFSLNLKLNEQIKSNLRMLYALNEQWEPYWKWISHYIDLELKIKPENLVQRIIQSLLGFNNPKKALSENLDLYIETLNLIMKYNKEIDQAITLNKIHKIEEARNLL